MSNETMQIHNAETGEIVIHELTDAEQAELEADRVAARAARAARIAAQEAKIEAAASAVTKLEAIGLTADEIAALRG
jgi:hypothetical protein